MASNKTLNLNVGVLGHVDSGKTTLAKLLSSVASTASFDKNPQSQERGITLDLGFSSFTVSCPAHLKSDGDFDLLQFTLVDCPGHASLIRTIIGGAQIIDMMVLVVDVIKGIQTQTAECLVIGEITCDHLIVVLNKVDLLREEKRSQSVDKVKKKIAKVLEKTKFAGAPMVAVAANPGGNTTPDNDSKAIGIQALLDALCHLSYIPKRSPDGPPVLAVDHCFAIKGQGTVMTATVVEGSFSVGDIVEIPSSKLTKKVKSIQVFKKSVEKARQGDRVGLCVTQFDPKLLERGAVCAPGHMAQVDAVIAEVNKIQYYKGSCSTNAKFHISVMHDTVTAKCSFFRSMNQPKTNTFDEDAEYLYLDELTDSPTSASFALLQFDRPAILSKNSILIGSKLDMDIHANLCRLAFHGRVMTTMNTKQQMNTDLSTLKVFKVKSKEGFVERMANEYEVICRDMFKKETKIQLFQNLKVQLSTGESGFIEGSFGQSGKVKIRVPEGLLPNTVEMLKGKKKGKKGEAVPIDQLMESIKVVLNFKRYIYDINKKIVQT